MAILAYITPTGNAIIDFTGLTGINTGILWLSIAIISGLLTSLAYGIEKRKVYKIVKNYMDKWNL